MHYKQDGTAFSDFDVERLAFDMCKVYQKKMKESKRRNEKHTVTYTVSTENIITAMRLMVCEGHLPHTKLIFQFKDNHVHVNEHGEFVKPIPKGFLDVEKNMLYKMIKKRLSKKNEQ